MNSDWIFKHLVILAVLPADGDVKAKSKSRASGVDSTAELKTQVVDSVTWQGGLDFDIKNETTCPWASTTTFRRWSTALGTACLAL